MGLFSRKKSARGGSAFGGKKVKEKEQAEKVEEIKEQKKQVRDKEEKVEKKEKKVKKESAKKVSGQAYKNLIRPLVSEKASWLDMNNQYVFEVSPRANKVEIKKAFQEVYNVKPIKVNFIKVKGKKIRRGRDISMTKHWKKAVISLKAGDKIEVYEGV